MQPAARNPGDISLEERIRVAWSGYRELIIMKTSISIACLLLFFLFVAACDKRGVEPRGRAIYFNSFETAQDTIGWIGVTAAMFVNDPAPEAGDRSLHIGGGCIQPAAYIDLPEQADAGHYRVCCWGKLEDSSQGGSVGLVVDAETEQRREIHLVVNRTEWTFYASEEIIRCPAHHRMRLEIMIGGFVPAGMFVDAITAERIF
jgi:hypothetical protein